MDVNAFANGPPSDVRMSHQSQRATTARALPESLVPESLVGQGAWCLVPENLVGRIRGSLLGLFRPGALQQSVATSDRVPYCSLSDLCEVVLLSRPGQETKLLLLAPLYTPMPPPIPHPPILQYPGTSISPAPFGVLIDSAKISVFLDLLMFSVCFYYFCTPHYFFVSSVFF